ncbi:GNAT family N-acetyltransferase [Roseibium aggregatum]|uniref:GNAT family N-acetyltransferase n=1 Tax=Roseibium aggregatum TaxID=187304 RepID=UPI001A8C8B72|nr:GNAT family protein [Roseibium aggregatum]MBN8180086.1 GNAT family N-acetyltransferase [Roseibium aggregatum]UES45753.1 GNAT family N-acetyltransferase [Roseibium aggregatum]
MKFEITSPVLTDRLVLRPMEQGDAEALHAYQSLPEVARFQFWEPRSLEEIRSKLTKWADMKCLDGEGTLAFAVEERKDGGVIGDVSLRVTNVEARQGTIGFTLNPQYQGRGFATEAGRALLRMGFEDLGLHRIFASCDARNNASWGVMERLGMRREAHFREHALFKGGWDEEFYYAILEDEWREQQENAGFSGVNPAGNGDRRG